ncbi:MAG: hypothetical protein OHK006_25520 [Thermodesulfovibrionales bacterium]
MLRALFSAVFLLCLALASPAVALDFTINDFQSSITVRQDSSFTVRETLAVEFHLQRHGIYRDIPFRYNDSFGGVMKTPLEVVSVEDGAGSPVKYKVIWGDSSARIRIGDPKKYVSGRVTYAITYRVENAILFLEDHDELYWNVTGSEWPAEIRKASCIVKVEGASASGNRAACYTGPRGSTESACAFTPAGDVIEFSTKRVLAAGQGFTIAYGWDKGIVAKPSAFTRFLWLVNIRQNWVFLLPFLVLGFMFTLWLNLGRDPQVRTSVTVMYGPPVHSGKPLTPSEVGTLVDEKIDSRDITATIVGLAVKGYIRIEEKKEEGIIFDSTDYFLKMLKEADLELTEFEQDLMNAVFSGSAGVMVSDLKNRFYRNLPGLKKTIYRDLVLKGFFGSNPEHIRASYVGAGIVTGVIIAAGLSYLFGDSIGDVRPFVCGGLSGLAVLGFAKFMPAKTRLGSSAYMHVLGFREFMERAEKDHLERMKDQNLFSKFFPYALALDVADNWAKAFEGIYQEPPGWYVSSSGMHAFRPVAFSHAIGTAMSTLSSAMTSAPRGSGMGSGGFGGGGSSGGGFGGGGGGSW